MGMIRKLMSVSTLGLIKYRSVREQRAHTEALAQREAARQGRAHREALVAQERRAQEAHDAQLREIVKRSGLT